MRISFRDFVDRRNFFENLPDDECTYQIEGFESRNGWPNFDLFYQYLNELCLCGVIDARDEIIILVAGISDIMSISTSFKKYVDQASSSELGTELKKQFRDAAGQIGTELKKQFRDAAGQIGTELKKQTQAYIQSSGQKVQQYIASGRK